MASISSRTQLANNPWVLGPFLLIGLLSAIKPHWFSFLTLWGGKDEDGEPTSLALAVTRAVGIVMAAWSGLYLLGYLNS